MTRILNENHVSIAFLVPADDDKPALRFGKSSPVESPTWTEVAEHLARKCVYCADGNERIEVMVLSRLDNGDDALRKANVVLAVGLTSAEDLAYAQPIFADRRAEYSRCQLSVDCGAVLPATVSTFDSRVGAGLVARFCPWTSEASAVRKYEQLIDLFDRSSSDEFIFGILSFVNQFTGIKVDWVKHSIDATWEKGPAQNFQEIYSMVDKCGDCIAKCVQDENCKECLSQLTAIDTRDQVLSYRTIVSYESELLRDFSFCILQKNNIFNCDASIPRLPVVEPIAMWRGRPLNRETANQILIAHLDDPAAPRQGRGSNVSWKVACGANVAYDQFPSQNQLFYPASNGKDLWYDPVFRVETLDGRSVWCKRHYKVRPQAVPGTFRFSVLDNGITSDEFWTIVGAADDLSWAVFHYAGAASAVGQRYLGGLLCTPDGELPQQSQLPEIWDTFRSAGIEPWELYCVDNREDRASAAAAGPAPLDHFRRAKVVES